MTIDENLTLLEETKSRLKTALGRKGQIVGYAPFSAYPDAVDEIVETNFKRYLETTGNMGISIPPTTTAIRRGFEGLSGLTAITIPESVETIVNNSFKGTKIRTVTVPSSVTTIGSSVFQGCTSLSSVTYNCSVYNSSMFSGCTSMKEIDMPNIVAIGTGMFAYCTSLSSVTIPDSCSSIGENAFCNCKNLKTVSIGTGCTSIGNRAFYGAYPNTVTLETMTITAPNPPSLGTDAIYTNITAIYVPAESVSAYQAAWTAFETKIQAIPT